MSRSRGIVFIVNEAREEWGRGRMLWGRGRKKIEAEAIYYETEARDVT